VGSAVSGDAFEEIFFQIKKTFFRVGGKKILRIIPGIKFLQRVPVIFFHLSGTERNPAGPVVKRDDVTVTEENFGNILLNQGKDEFPFLGFFGEKIPDIPVKYIEIGGFGTVFDREFLNPLRKILEKIQVVVNIFCHCGPSSQPAARKKKTHTVPPRRILPVLS
jgi:hypothetical protein